MPSSPGTTGAKAGWRPSLVGWRPLLLGARTLLGAPGIATRSKDASRLEAIAIGAVTEKDKLPSVAKALVGALSWPRRGRPTARRAR